MRMGQGRGGTPHTHCAHARARMALLAAVWKRTCPVAVAIRPSDHADAADASVSALADRSARHAELLSSEERGQRREEEGPRPRRRRRGGMAPPPKRLGSARGGRWGHRNALEARCQASVADHGRRGVWRMGGGGRSGDGLIGGGGGKVFWCARAVGAQAALDFDASMRRIAWKRLISERGRERGCCAFAWSARTTIGIAARTSRGARLARDAGSAFMPAGAHPPPQMASALFSRPPLHRGGANADMVTTTTKSLLRSSSS